jgi:hypothetical protein
MGAKRNSKQNGIGGKINEKTAFERQITGGRYNT